MDAGAVMMGAVLLLVVDDGDGERDRMITVAPGPHRFAGVDVRCW